MLKIFKQNTKSKYQERLTKAFPNQLHSDLKAVIKILPLENRKVKLSDGTIYQVDYLIHDNELNLILDNETLIIPYRIYFDEPNPDLEKTLTDKQKDIMSCIYLRHDNGHIREKRLNLLSDNSYKWTIPFIVQLIGEYIYELLPIIDNKINENTLDFYAEYINENSEYWQKTENRMISYWNEYYRSEFPNLKEYLGFKLVNRLKKRPHNKS